MNDERGSWYLLTAIVLGIGLGLLYSWIIAPVEFVDTHPVSLRADYKDQYREVIAVAYEATGNLERARERLALLGEDNPSLVLVAQAQRALAGEGNFNQAQAMANLAAALGQVPTPLPTEPEMTDTQQPTQTPTVTASEVPTLTPSRTPTEYLTQVFTVTASVSQTIEITESSSGTPTRTGTPDPGPTATQTPSPTSSQTPTATLAPPFVLDNLVEVCNPVIAAPQIQVFVSNAAGVGIPGVEIIVSWNGGEEHFYTGLKSDIDIGYADFVMEPAVVYVLQVAEGGQLITELTAPQCTTEGGESYWGSIRLVFSHP